MKQSGTWKAESGISKHTFTNVSVVGNDGELLTNPRQTENRHETQNGYAWL